MRPPAYLLGWALCASNLVDAVDVKVRAANWTVGQVVQTSSGPVSGHPASVNIGVSEYLGIPYAVPPVGDLRWTAPKPFNGTAAINGTNFVWFSLLLSIQIVLVLFFCTLSFPRE
jgi:Carboxylesterase family